MRRIGVISDVHCGSVVGLWPGKHRIEGGGEYVANAPQQWLNKCWQHARPEIKRCDTIVLNGDMIQGVNARDGQLIGSSVAAQVDAAHALLWPICEGKRVYVIRGTEWHDGRAAEHVEMLAERLGAVKDPETGQYSWWELYLDMGGPVAHFAHHVGVSSVPWYEATVPLRDTLLELSELWREYADKMPNVRLVARSHRHRLVHVQVPPDLQVVVTPGWQLRTAYAYKKGASMLPQVGWVLVEWNGKDVVVKPRMYSLPALHVEAAHAD